MKKLSIFILVVITFGSCSKEPAYKEYLIEVDSLAINSTPTPVSSGLFEINLYGTISPNGCSSFSHLNITRQNQDIIIEAWKNVHLNQNVCPTVMVYLDQKILCNRDTLPDNFNIKAKEPDGSYLEKQMK